MQRINFNPQLLLLHVIVFGATLNPEHQVDSFRDASVVFWAR